MIAKVMMVNFPIHLALTHRRLCFRRNMHQSFWTSLAGKIHLSEGEWQVGMRQIMYPLL